MTVSKLKVSLRYFFIIQIKLHLIHWHYGSLKLVTTALVWSDLLCAVETNTEIPFGFCVEISFSNIRIAWKKLFEAVVEQFSLGFVSRTDVGRYSQSEGILKLAFELSDHVKLNLDSFLWLNVSYSDIHDGWVFLLLRGHHYCIAFALSSFVFCLDHFSKLYWALDNGVFVSDFEFGQSVSWINWNGVVNLKGFAKRIFVFLDGLDFGKLVFDIHFVFVGNDGEKAFFIVLDKEVAKWGQGSASQRACAILDLHIVINQ